MKTSKWERSKKYVLAAAIKLAEEKNYLTFTRKELSDYARIGINAIDYYYADGIEGLRNELIEEAIRTNNTAVLAQAVVLKDKRVKRISNILINEIAEHIRNAKV